MASIESDLERFFGLGTLLRALCSGSTFDFVCAARRKR